MAEKKRTQKSYRAYLSHTIRGKAGKRATTKTMQQNCLKAHAAAETLRSYLLDWHRMDNIPLLDIYVPGEHDEFIQLAYAKKYITIEQILEIDCEILSQCDMLIILGDYMSKGMQVEFDFAESIGLPIMAIDIHKGGLTENDKLTLLAALDFIMED